MNAKEKKIFDKFSKDFLSIEKNLDELKDFISFSGEEYEGLLALRGGKKSWIGLSDKEHYSNIHGWLDQAGDSAVESNQKDFQRNQVLSRRMSEMEF